MAIGGIFGVMNTMFAAISQRTKDIGALRLSGFTVLANPLFVSFGISGNRSCRRLAGYGTRPFPSMV